MWTIAATTNRIRPNISKAPTSHRGPMTSTATTRAVPAIGRASGRQGRGCGTVT